MIIVHRGYAKNAQENTISAFEAVFVGWLDAIPGSEWIFKTLIPQNRLAKMKRFYESRGFKVYGGVLNREEGMRYFHEAGIDDIFTDEVEAARSFQESVGVRH